MNRELDQLLTGVRAAGTTHPDLHDVESLVWQRIRATENEGSERRLSVHLMVVAIAVAFVWGIVSGTQVSRPTLTAAVFLVDEMEILPPAPGGLLR